MTMTALLHEPRIHTNVGSGPHEEKKVWYVPFKDILDRAIE